MRIEIPLRTVSGMNAREHWRVRAKRVKSEREAVAWALHGKAKPATPCTVTITRVGPSNGLDCDNLASSGKAIRDQVAQWLGVDDKHSGIVRYWYAQARGPKWLTVIEFTNGITT